MGRTNGYQTGGSYCRLGGSLIPQEGHIGDLWERVFPSEETESSLEAQLAQGRSGVLEALEGQYEASQIRASATDELKLQLHREHLAALKLRIESMGDLECSIPDEGILDGVNGTTSPASWTESQRAKAPCWTTP